MIKKKKVFSIILAASILLGAMPVKASESQGMENEEVNYTLTKLGYDLEMIKEMDEEDKLEIAEAFEKDANLVDVQTSVLTVDNISLIEYYTNTEDEELIETGFTMEEVEKVRENLETLEKMDEKEMANQYEVSITEAKMLKKALEKNDDYEIKNLDSEKVTTSGSIATSKMTFAMSTVNNSTSTAPSYTATITYNWLSPYFVDIFDDALVVAWGGNLNSKSITSSAKYYKGNYYSNGWGNLQQTSTWSREETANKGIIFKTPQSKNGAAWQNKTGSVKLTVYQTKFQGYDTKILSQFCHKVLSLSSAGISISGSGPSVSISVTTAYDTSAQKSKTIGY